MVRGIVNTLYLTLNYEYAEIYYMKKDQKKNIWEQKRNYNSLIKSTHNYLLFSIRMSKQSRILDEDVTDNSLSITFWFCIDKCIYLALKIL